MKTLIRFLAAAVLLTVVSTSAEATSTTVAVKSAVDSKPNPSAVAYRVDLPTTFAATDSCYFVTPGPALLGMLDLSSGAGVVNLVLAINTTTAADSVDTQIFVGSTPDGPWTSISALTLEGAGGLTGAANIDVISAGAVSTYKPANYWQFLVKNKGATLTSKKYFATFYTSRK